MRHTHTNPCGGHVERDSIDRSITIINSRALLLKIIKILDHYHVDFILFLDSSNICRRYIDYIWREEIYVCVYDFYIINNNKKISQSKKGRRPILKYGFILSFNYYYYYYFLTVK